MLVSRVIFCLAVAYVFNVKDASGNAPSSQPKSTLETPSRETGFSDQEAIDNDIPQQPLKEEQEKVKEKSSQEKFIVPYVPDYPER